MSLLVAHGLSVPARQATGRAPLPGPVDLSLAADEAVAVHGPSGAGKTTLLRALARLEPRATGQVRFAGQPICGDAVPGYRRSVQYLPQAAVRLPGTVEDNLRAAFDFASAGRDAGGTYQRPQARELCALLGLPDDVLERPADALSGGEAQRMALARALLLRPQVLLLDEPTASLDAHSRQQVEQAITAWRRAASGRALLLVSHDPEQRARLTERALRIEGGRLVADADPAGVSGRIEEGT